MQTYATAMPLGIVLRLITIGRANSSARAREYDISAYSGINLAWWHPVFRIPVQRSFVHARPKIDAACCPHNRDRGSPARASGAGRNRGALRHFDGGYSADDGPAGSRRGRLSIHGLHDL